MKAANKRKIEQSIILEKVEAKKRKEEHNDVENKARFVTKAYEEKLQLNKQELIRQQLEDIYDDKNTVNEEV